MADFIGVQCPTCESIKSIKKLYRTAEIAAHSVGRRHSTVCNECGAEFTYRPMRQGRKKWWLFGRMMSKVVVTEMTTIKEGELS